MDAYITDIGTKDFNGVALFDGTTRGITIDSDGKTFSMTGVNMGGANYTGINSVAVGTTTGAAAALTAVKTAITQLTTDRATVGANVSRLQHTGDQLKMIEDQLAASNSRIRDVDVAEESTNYARYNILVQSGTAMLAQANTLPQSALRLLG